MESSKQGLQNSPSPHSNKETVKRDQIGTSISSKIDYFKSVLDIHRLFYFNEIYFIYNEMETADAPIKVLKSWPSFYHNVSHHPHPSEYVFVSYNKLSETIICLLHKMTSPCVIPFQYRTTWEEHTRLTFTLGKVHPLCFPVNWDETNT